MPRVENKVILVSGAGGGLGRALAQRLAAEGARLALTDVNTVTLAETVNLIKAADTPVVSNAGDIADADTADRLVATAVTAFGTINGLCNVAGMLGGGALEQATPTDFDRVMHTNCLSQLLLIQRVAPHMRNAGGGSIANVSSVGGLVALPYMSLYCASKAAVIGLTRAVALELGPDIRCNVICPGGIDSTMSRDFLDQFSGAEREQVIAKLVGRQIQKRFAEPREIAELLLFLMSDESSFITGATLPIEAGHSAW